MRKFTYTLTFSPYINFVRARNYKHAKELLKSMWSEYDLDKILTSLVRQQ